MNLYFNLFKVKFAKLDELMKINNIPSHRGDEVNVFINLEPVLFKLCNPKVDEYLRVSGRNKHIEIIAEFLNLASHYRLYFTKNGIKSNIYMYAQYPFTDIFKNSIYNKDYRKYYQYRFNNDISYFALSEVLNTAFPLLQMIVEYIEGVYFIQSGSIENSLVPKIIQEHTKNNHQSFIVSHSIYDFQYVNHDCSIIVSKQAESELITQDNAIKYICKENSLPNFDVSSSFIPFVLSIIGNKHRNIYNIKGFGLKKTFKLIERAISDGLITSSTDNIHLLMNAIKPIYRDIIMDNFNCTDIHSQYIQLNTKDKYEITSQCVNKFDNVSLKKINDQFFEGSPINLMELTAQVNNTKTKQKVIFK